MSATPESSFLLQEQLVQRQEFSEAEFLDIYDVDFMKDTLFSILSENGGLSSLVVEAAQFAENVLEGKNRKKGSREGYPIPDVIHSYRVAIRLARSGITDEVTMATALLHDVAEDTEVTIDNIKDKFGEEIGNNVDALSKNYNNGPALPMEACFIQMRDASNVVRNVKYADRIDNLQSFLHMNLRMNMRPGKTARESLWENLYETEEFILKLNCENEILRSELLNLVDIGNDKLGRVHISTQKRRLSSNFGTHEQV